MIYIFCLKGWKLNLHDKTEYVIHIRNLKQKLNDSVFKFNQNVWLKPYIDMNSDLRKKIKKRFWQRL